MLGRATPLWLAANWSRGIHPSQREYYSQVRAYDCTTSRFLQVDSVGEWSKSLTQEPQHVGTHGEQKARRDCDPKPKRGALQRLQGQVRLLESQVGLRGARIAGAALGAGARRSGQRSKSRQTLSRSVVGWHSLRRMPQEGECSERSPIEPSGPVAAVLCRRAYPRIDTFTTVRATTRRLGRATASRPRTGPRRAPLVRRQQAVADVPGDKPAAFIPSFPAFKLPWNISSPEIPHRCRWLNHWSAGAAWSSGLPAAARDANLLLRSRHTATERVDCLAHGRSAGTRHPHARGGAHASP
jgi:hypothetical protein